MFSKTETARVEAESREPTEARRIAARIVLIDDDPVYGEIIRRWADANRYHLDVFTSLQEIGYVGLLSRYDLAIVDYDLNGLDGQEVAEYMQYFFGGKPVLLISSSDREEELRYCPDCVKCFLPKSVGVDRILSTSLSLIRK